MAAAARGLGTEQNTLSRQMAGLELSCGGRLFHRSAGVRAPNASRISRTSSSSRRHSPSCRWKAELSRRASE
ncbi:MAG: helix-turn-helix domain-containing protein [Gemmatimonadota bacterium]